ncbi:MAG: hypothetical protein DMF63_12025 [Acidobacteria bacterium]|nr:MAG: hypothetical protein DMF63_12025 [Acidobacteriota bacterium]
MGELAPGFRVDLLFPDEYSNFVAEIYFKDRLVLLVSQDKGLDSAEVEFDRDVRGLPERMSLRELEEAINYARRRQHELRRHLGFRNF